MEASFYLFSGTLSKYDLVQLLSNHRCDPHVTPQTPRRGLSAWSHWVRHLDSQTVLLNLSIVDIYNSLLQSFPVDCKLFSGFFGLYPLNTTSTSTPSPTNVHAPHTHTNKKCQHSCLMSEETQLSSHTSKGPHSISHLEMFFFLLFKFVL